MNILYPTATRFKPKSVDESFHMYQGVVAITAFLPKGILAENQILRAILTVQACIDTIYLPPGDLPLTA